MRKFFLDLLSPLNTPALPILVALIVFLCVKKDITGDLGLIGQIVFSNAYHKQSKFEENIEKQLYWCETNELKDFNIVFMGDSFTRDHSYPYYVSSTIHKLSAKFISSNLLIPEQIFVALCNADIEMPPVVVLESVEREFIERLADLDFSSSSIEIPVADVYRTEKGKRTDFTTFYKNRIIDNRSVRHIHLKDSLFSCPNKEKELYFYYVDLQIPTESQIQTAISKLDTLFQLANEKHIQLFYVIAADKYDVYQDFAVDNPYPRKIVLDSFSRFESNPFFVNTRPLLYEKAKEGETDLYYADDTHWSPVGAKIVAEEIARRIDSLGILQN